MTELYFVNENGQMEINMDSLLLLTNEEFTDAVIDAELEGFEVINVKTWDNSKMVSVYMKYCSTVLILDYSNYQRERIERKGIGVSDVQAIADALGLVINND